MGSFAPPSREKCHFKLRPEDPWSAHDWPRPFGMNDRLVGTGSPREGTDLADWTVDARRSPATTDRQSSIQQAPSTRPHPESSSKGSGHNGASAEELLDNVRWAIQRSPETAHAAVLQLMTFLTPPAAVEPTGARGGLAPWQKRKADRYLREHLDQPVRLNAVAEHVALSVSHFSRAFKESFGTTPHQHIVRLRVELAQHLMLTTEDPLSQIAIACGLADQAHLSKLFRRLVGETPNAWRRRNLSDAQIEARSRRSARTQFAGLGSTSYSAAAPA
jgi:AraC family transcriptional regulator